MRSGLVRVIWLASVVCGGDIHRVARLVRLSIRVIRPVAVKLLDRGLWGKS